MNVEMIVAYPRFFIKKGERGTIVGHSEEQGVPLVKFEHETIPIHPNMFKVLD